MTSPSTGWLTAASLAPHHLVEPLLSDVPLRVQLVRIPILERPLLIPALPACHFLSPTTLIPILLFLRPQNLLHPDRSYHHPKHEQPRNDQADRQRAPDILNRAIIVERARNGERGRR